MTIVLKMDISQIEYDNTIGKTNQHYEEIFDENINLNKLTDNNSLNSNQSFSNFRYRQPMFDFHPLYYSTLSNTQNRLSKNNIQNEYNNICLFPHKIHRNKLINELMISPNRKKLEFSDQYIETENEESANKTESIHYFGEQMLKRNKNYNFSKNLYNNNFIAKDENLKISLKRHHSYSNINQDQISPDFSKNISQNNKKSYFLKSGNKLKRNSRYSHNIVNRKKMRKLVMEKCLNEEFISQSNKKKKNNIIPKLKKINFIENSMIDNDSLNEIIKEFEKEIEDEEKKENKCKKINLSYNDTLRFSFLSDNDYSIMSKDSTNNSKIKKIHYYKTKNIDMEKNYDFIIYGNKNKNSLKK